MRSFRRLRRHLGKVLMAYWTSGADLLTDDESVDHLRAKTLETVASALRRRRRYQRLASSLGLSTSQVHRSVESGQQSGLLLGGSKTRVDRRGLSGLLVSGVRHVYPAQAGKMARGMPTAHSAPPLSGHLTDDGPALVWPFPEGQARGMAVGPLCKHVPAAAERDRTFYEMLALVDALRIGRARERALAEEHLREHLGQEKA